MADIVSAWGTRICIPLVCQVSRTAVNSTCSIKKTSKHLAHLEPFFLESMQKIVQTRLRTIFRRCATCLRSKQNVLLCKTQHVHWCRGIFFSFYFDGWCYCVQCQWSQRMWPWKVTHRWGNMCKFLSSGYSSYLGFNATLVAVVFSCHVGLSPHLDKNQDYFTDFWKKKTIQADSD